MRRLVAIAIGPVALALALVVGSAGVATAYFKGSGAGSGTTSTASLAAPALSVPATAANTVTVTFDAQGSLQPASSAHSQITYTVQRRLGGGAFADVASGGCAGAKAFGTVSCTDAPASSASYSYRAIASLRSWTATSAETSSVAVSVDTTAPAVQSIARLDADPSSAPSVRWTVTFSESVTGVGTADFALARTGTVSGGSVTTVTGSATTYTVTASSGSGSGTLGLNLVDDDSIADAASNPLGGSGSANGNVSGQTYTLDRTAPAVSSIAAASANPTNAATVSWTVTFSEAVTGVDSADFTLARTGTVSASAQVQSVSGSGPTRTVTATTVSGEGTLGLNFASDGTVVDALGNATTAGFTGATYTIDRTAPARTAMVMLDTNANGKVDRVTVTFGETLAASTATAPWTLANVPSGGTLAAVSTSGATATLTLDEGAGAADTSAAGFSAALAASATGIRDGAGNQSSFAAAAPADGAAPVRTAMSMFDANHNGKVDQVAVTFSETVATPIVATAFTFANTPSAGSLVAASASASTNVVTLTVSEGAGPASTAVGTFTVALAAAATGVRDSAANQASFAAVAPADKAGPVPIAMSDANGAIDGKIEIANTISATFSEAIASGLPASTPITEAGAAGSNDKLTIAGFTNGALDMGSANYVLLNQTVTFAGTSALSGAGATVTITVGACTGGTCGSERNGSGKDMVYVPATTLLDAAGNAAGGSLLTNFKIF